MSGDDNEDPHKALCDDLARKLEQRPNRRLLEIALKPVLRQARSEPTEVAPVAGGPEERARGAEPRPISIWNPEIVNGDLIFVRPERGILGDSYSPRERLIARKPEGRRRVCFFGESVAVGYLYEPHLTPAALLEDQLRTVAGDNAYEVVDLSKSNESLVPLVATVRRSLQLDPDLLVIFAGNNWNFQETEVSPYIPRAETRRRYAEALRAGGIAGVRELGRRVLGEKTRSALAEIARIARSRSLPVVLVVPEVNLADWESRQPVVWCGGGATARWHQLYARAEQQLAQNQWEAAIAAARQMLEIDGGSCPSSYRILARANLGSGRLEEAARAARAEVDSDLMPTMCYLHGPQATSLDREVLRRAAREHGFSCVDLPQVYAEHTGSPLPGRRLFLDYCHLTVEGTKVAMAAVAAELLRLSGVGRAPVEWSALVDSLPDPRISPEADATAKLGAAVHNAHRLLAVGPKAPILEYWCRAALEASAGIEQTMLELIEMRCAPGPEVITAGLQRNLASPYRLMLQHGLQWPNLDVELIRAICDALEAKGRPVRGAVTRTLVKQRGVGSEPVELAASGFYHWELGARFFSEVLGLGGYGHQAVYRSPWPVSAFALVCDGSRDIGLDATLRRSPFDGPESQPAGSAVVTANGHQVGAVSCGREWSRTLLKVKREWLRNGINRVAVHWPAPSADGDEMLRRAVARLDRGLGTDVHPVFGEIFSLRALAAG